MADIAMGVHARREVAWPDAKISLSSQLQSDTCQCATFRFCAMAWMIIRPCVACAGTRGRVSQQQHVSSEYRPDIDGLRAVAVSLVVLFHASPRLMQGGFVGVDVFFVISGYLITGILRREMGERHFSVRGFYARRIRRLAPALALVLAATLLAGFLWLIPAQLLLVGKFTWGGVLFWDNMLAARDSGYFGHAAVENPLLHLWSLGVEEQFYLVWPILLMVALRSGRAGIAVCFALALASLAASIVVQGQSWGFYAPMLRFWELAAGAALVLAPDLMPALPAGPALSCPAGIRLRARDIAGVAGLCLIVFAATRLHASDRYPGWRALLPVGGAVLVIAAGAGAIANRWVLAHRLPVWLGRISFPLYLWHWPLLVSANLVTGEWPSPGFALVLVGLSVVLAALTFHGVERPMRRLADWRPRPVIAGLVCAMLVLALAGRWVEQGGGLPGRYPPQLQWLAQIANPYQEFDYPGVVRGPVCFEQSPMHLVQTAPNSCVEQRGHTMVLLGDSFAATLYHGLHAATADLDLGIAQLTAGNAPPFLVPGRRIGEDRDLEAFNRERLQAIGALQPDIVLLHWLITALNTDAEPATQIARVREFAEQVRAVSPGTSVVVLGPGPLWKGSLLANLLRHGMGPFASSGLAGRMSTGLEDSSARYDAAFAAGFPPLGIGYISALAEMCNAQGCVAWVGPGERDIANLDSGHLTYAGSRYLGERIAPHLRALLQERARGGQKAELVSQTPTATP